MCPVNVEGLQEVKDRLAALEDGKLTRSIQRSGSRAAGKVLLAGQQQTVPVESGKLLESLGIQVHVSGGNVEVLIGPDRKWNFIGRFHEFGTEHEKASFWMTRAYDETHGEALDAYIERVRTMLDKHTMDELMSAIQEALSEDTE
jgi:HK97 gp10 family phage protein